MVEATVSDVGGVNWQRAHAELQRLARCRAGLELEEGQWLLAAQRAQTHLRFGHGSFAEYIERLFGHSPRITREKLRVAAALERLPELAEALRTGETSWSAVRELTRVATTETEHHWLESARGKTVQQVERLVSGRNLGSLPTDPAEPGLERHVLRFDLSGEVLATFREALAEVRREAGGALDDDEALLLIARRVLSGPSETGRSSYQVTLTVCEDCERTRQTGNGQQVQISAETAAMARCDAQVVVGGIPTSCDDEEHGDRLRDPREETKGRPGRAAQTIPPALRRAVLTRDQGQCQAPGCRHATYVDLHHIQLREAGGQNEADNLVTLCSAHHRAAHRGLLRIEGRLASGLRFLHADGTPYGQWPVASAVDVWTQAFGALRGLGFREPDTRRALRAVEPHVGTAASIEQVLRAALEFLTPASPERAS